MTKGRKRRRKKREMEEEIKRRDWQKREKDEGEKDRIGGGDRLQTNKLTLQQSDGASKTSAHKGLICAVLIRCANNYSCTPNTG